MTARPCQPTAPPVAWPDLGVVEVPVRVAGTREPHLYIGTPAQVPDLERARHDGLWFLADSDGLIPDHLTAFLAELDHIDERGFWSCDGEASQG